MSKFSGVRWSHRGVVSAVVDALVELQGVRCPPAETRVITHTNGTYEIQGIMYPLGVTAEQLEWLRAQSPYILKTYIDFSVQGSTGRCAVCALVNASARRDDRDNEAAAVAEEDDDDASKSEFVRLDGGARRRAVGGAKKPADDEPGWIEGLFRAWK